MIKGQLLNIDLPLQGMTQLASIIDIVKNEKLYKQRLNVLEKHKKEIVTLIQVLGEVEEIEAIKVEVSNTQKQVSVTLQKLEDEKVKVNDLATKAQLGAKSIESAALERMDGQKTILDMKERELHAKKVELSEREREIQLSEVRTEQAKTEVQTELKRLERLQKVADSARLDFEARQAKLEKAISGI